MFLLFFLLLSWFQFQPTLYPDLDDSRRLGRTTPSCRRSDMNKRTDPSCPCLRQPASMYPVALQRSWNKHLWSTTPQILAKDNDSWFFLTHSVMPACDQESYAKSIKNILEEFDPIKNLPEVSDLIKNLPKEAPAKGHLQEYVTPTKEETGHLLKSFQEEKKKENSEENSSCFSVNSKAQEEEHLQPPAHPPPEIEEEPKN